MLPVDYFHVHPQHAHWSLVVMLVLTQLSVGAFIAELFLDRVISEPAARGPIDSLLRPLHAFNALAIGLLALASSLSHLGRPQYAYRAVLGLRHSWLSREIVAFGVFAALAIAYAVATMARHPWSDDLAWAVALAGALGVFCSAMVYVFTRRECWSFARTTVRFALTALLLGLAASWLSILLAILRHPSSDLMLLVPRYGSVMCRSLITVAATKLLWEASILRHLLSGRMTASRRSAMLLMRELSSVALARFALGLLGGIVMPAVLLNTLPEFSAAGMPQFMATTAMLFIACLAGELLERYLFFAACAAPRMPGKVE